jgi:hypothetical protein
MAKETDKQLRQRLRTTKKLLPTQQDAAQVHKVARDESIDRIMNNLKKKKR